MSRTYNGSLLRESEANGIRIFEVRYEAGSAIARHAHPHAGFSVLIRGAFSECYQRRSLEWSTGTVGFHPADEEHSNRTETAGAQVLIVELTPWWLERARDEGLRPDRSVVAYGGPLTWLGARLIAEARLGDPASRLAVQGIALEMLAAVARASASGGRDGGPGWLHRARDFLHASFLEPVSLRVVAEQVSAPPVRLARAFRKAYGCSIGEYVRVLRVEEARRQLSATDAPLSGIAASVGFCDQPHFTRVFKQVTGLTPQAYRALVRPGPIRTKC